MPKTIIVSRHGESVASAHGIANGDPSRDAGLTARGRGQASELGTLVANDGIKLCITSLFPRARETGEIALTGRAIPFTAIVQLNDIRYGSFEGRSSADYRDWSMNHEITDRIPDGGESRADVAGRVCEAFAEVLARDESCILVVTHELLIAFLEMAIDGKDPAPEHPDIPYATPYRFTDVDVAGGVERIGSWLERLPSAAI